VIIMRKINEFSLAFVLAVTAAMVLPSAARSQGNPTGNTSDVSGPSVTGGEVAGGAFSPSSPSGTTSAIATASSQAAVVAATATITAALGSGSLVSMSGAPISAEAQGLVLGVITGTSVTTGQAADLARALSAAGGPAATILPALLAGLSGLASSPSQLAPAIGNYNQFVKAASGEFLTSPPQAFLAVQAVLSQLSSAARGTK
jgi:hypothetical protein